MCDYSLMGFPNRLASAGEELVVKRFSTGTLGLAEPEATHSGWWAAVKAFFKPVEQPVVCVPPGALLKLRDIPEPLRLELNVGCEEDVVFTQISAMVNSYRDAVRFGNGRDILLQRLQEGQRVKILDLSARDTAEPAREDRFQFSALLTR